MKQETEPRHYWMVHNDKRKMQRQLQQKATQIAFLFHARKQNDKWQRITSEQKKLYSQYQMTKRSMANMASKLTREHEWRSKQKNDTAGQNNFFLNDLASHMMAIGQSHCIAFPWRRALCMWALGEHVFECVYCFLRNNLHNYFMYIFIFWLYLIFNGTLDCRHAT